MLAVEGKDPIRVADPWANDDAVFLGLNSSNLRARMHKFAIHRQ